MSLRVRRRSFSASRLNSCVLRLATCALTAPPIITPTTVLPSVHKMLSQSTLCPEDPTPPRHALSDLLRLLDGPPRLHPTRLLRGLCGRSWRGFPRRCFCGGFYGRDALGERGDDAPVLPVPLVGLCQLLPKCGYQEVRTVGRLVGGRTRLVGGCTAWLRLVEQDVDRPAFPFYRECAAPYAPAHGLGADTEDFGSLGHGRTAYGRRAVLSGHARSLP